MVFLFYPSDRETSVSRTVGRGRTASEHCSYREYRQSRRFIDASINIENKLEQEHIIEHRSRTVEGNMFETIQRESHFHDQTLSSNVSKSNAFASSTKFNPEAKPFVPKAIE